MTLQQALSIATLLIEFELESPQVQPPPVSWQQDLQAAKKAIQAAIERQPTGEFFIAPVSIEHRSRRRAPQP